MSLNHFQQTTLSNGLRVVTDHMPAAQSVTLGVWTGTGARYESKQQNGLSHLLEHMVFKGTQSRTAEKIYEEIDSVGGEMNAYTGKENTAYFVKMLGQDMALGVDIITDMVKNPTFPDEEMIKEQDVVLQEIGMYADTPDDQVHENFEKTAFPDQPLGRSILGTTQSVKAFTTQDLHNYLNQFYHTSSMVLVAAGQVDHDDFVREIEKRLGSLADSTNQNKYDQAVYKGGLIVQEKELEQVHIMVGFQGVSHASEHFHAAFLTNIILGASDSSRINKEVREKRGLAYSAYSFRDHYHDDGLFCVYAGTGTDVAETTLRVILNEFDKLRDGISEAELTRAKTLAEASLLMKSESSYNRADRLGRQMLFGDRLETLEETIECIKSVTKQNINEFVNLLLASRATVSLLGPAVKKLADQSMIHDKIKV